ncbi:MAG TPA: hypothetical protein VK842_06245 [bacterium]|nr:hypothetical protein [bacterium]
MALALGWAAALPALSTLTGPLGLGAAGMAAGGAVVATAQGNAALDWNPAGLTAEGWDLGYDLGLGGPASSVQQGLGMSSTLDQGLGVGLRAADQYFPQAGGYNEGSLGLGLAAELGPGFSVGTVQKFMTADPGGLRGWSMDAGVKAGLPLAGTWRLDLGAAVSDLASSLAWSNGLEEVQPSVTRLGLALEAKPGTWLAVQEDHLDRQGNGGADQWRVGAQAAWWGQRLALRAGATQATGGPLYWSAGLGAGMHLLGQDLGADYGVLAPLGGGDNGGLRHLASLGWHFGLAEALPDIGASLLSALADQERRIRLARIQVLGLPEGTHSWVLQLRDAGGRTVKTFKGKGQAVPVLVWDGRSGAGAQVPAAGLNYRISAETARGPLRGQGPLGAPLQIQPPKAQAAAAAAVKPAVRLKGGELAVDGADFNVAALAGSDATGWELRIVDAGGHTVKTIQGTGTPPRDVRWEGKDDFGQPVADSLGAGYELRVTNSSGETHVAAAAPLVAASDFPALAAQAQPSPAPACKVLPDHSCDCVFYFQAGSSLLDASSMATLEQAQRSAMANRLRHLHIYGHLGEGEDESSGLAQTRADRVLRAMVEDDRMDWATATAEGQDGAFERPRVELRMEP